MAKKTQDISRRVKELESKVKELEVSNLRKRGKSILVTGLIIFIFSLVTKGLLSDLSRFLSVGTIGFVLIIIGFIFVFVSRPTEKIKRKKITNEDRLEPKKQRRARYKSSSDSVTDFFAKYIPKKKEDLETNIGVKWFTSIGIVSLVIGMIYFLKYAFDHDWIGPTGRVVIGIIISLVLLVLGSVFDRKKYILYSRALTGGGFAVLYGSVYAAHNFYNLVSLPTDLIILSIVVILGIIFSVKYNSRVISYISFFLGYLTAYLTGESNIHTLAYSAILTLGLLVLVYKKRWTYLGLGGFVATYVIHYVWLKDNIQSHLTHLIFLVVYLIMFVVMSLHLKKYVKFKKDKDFTLASKIAVCVVFLLSFIFTFISTPTEFVSTEISFNYLLFYLLLTVVLIFVVFRNKWSWIGLAGALATYTSFIMWYGLNEANPSLFVYTSIFLTIYFLLYSVLSFLLENKAQKKGNIGNILMILVNSFFYFLVMHYEVARNYDNLNGLFTIGLSVVYLILTSISYQKRMRHLFVTNLVLTVTYLTIAVPVQLNKEWVTISWAVEGLILILLGIKLKNTTLRVLGYVVGVITTVKALTMDTGLQAFDINNIFGSTRLFVFLVAIIYLYLSSLLLYRNKDLLKEEKIIHSFFKVKAKSFIPAILGVLGTVLTSTIFVLEGENWSSLWWSLQAFVMLFVAVKSRKKELRYLAYALGLLTALKIFVFDWALREFQFSDITGSVRFFVFITAIITFYISARICDNLKILKDRQEGKFAVMGYDVLATLLTVVLLALEFKKDWMSVAWAIYAITLLLIGFGFKDKLFRILGILLFGVTILKVFIIDLKDLELFFRIISFIGLGVILLIAAYIYHKYKERIKGWI